MRGPAVVLALALGACARPGEPATADLSPTPPSPGAVGSACASGSAEGGAIGALDERAEETAGPAHAKGTAGLSDEALIGELEELARRRATPAELDRFVAERPGILSANAKPYGSAFTWMLERALEPAALALLRAGFDPDDRSGLGDTRPLALAAGRGLDAVVRELLARKVDPNEKGYWGTALHAAAAQGRASTVKILLAAGADPNVRADDHQFTPLIEAATERHDEVVKLLLAAGADVRAVDDDGRTALRWAVFAYRPQEVHVYEDLAKPHGTHFVDPGPATVVELLLAGGAPVDEADAEGNTALHDAAFYGAKRAAQVLLSRGASRRATNGAGETPYAVAVRRGEKDLASLLRP